MTFFSSLSVHFQQTCRLDVRATHPVQSVVLLDPYAKAVVGRRQYGQLGPELMYEEPEVLGYAPTWPQAACALPSAGDTAFDWEGDKPLNRPMHELVIYEMHVRGFTKDEASGVRAPGVCGFVWLHALMWCCAL
jgi:pullulanase/glycogen debranching enzyme